MWANNKRTSNKCEPGGKLPGSHLLYTAHIGACKLIVKCFKYIAES